MAQVEDHGNVTHYTKRASVNRWLNRLLFVMNIALFLTGMWFFGSRKLVESDHIEYKDLIVIILTAVAVLLAVVTLFVGVLAIYGYSTIRELAARTAADTAREVTPAAAQRVVEDAIQNEEPDQPGTDLVQALQRGEPPPGPKNDT